MPTVRLAGGDMNRRWRQLGWVIRQNVISVAIAVAILVWVLARPAEPQPTGKAHRIGFLSYQGCARSLASDGFFKKGLAASGYVEGRNLVIECRDAPGQVERLTDLAVELVRHNIDILVAEGTPSSLAAKRATSTTPIVILAVADPVASGLVPSLARPGGNITGISLFPALELAPKVLELLKEVAPQVSRTAILMDRSNSAQVLTDAPVDEISRTLGTQPLRFDVRRKGDIQRALTAAVAQRSESLFVYPLPVDSDDIRQIAQFASTNRLPAVTFWEGYAELGFLIFYGSRIAHQYGRAGVYVDKILRGAKPSDLPIEQPATFQMVVNLRTAKALGLTIPPSLLARADQVIE
jgi:ABC-type uncharacterized transport system substrate-binding protein